MISHYAYDMILFMDIILRITFKMYDHTAYQLGQLVYINICNIYIYEYIYIKMYAYFNFIRNKLKNKLMHVN